MVNEVRNDWVFNHENETVVRHFGYRVMRNGKECFTIVDFGNIWKFFESKIQTLIANREKEAEEKTFKIVGSWYKVPIRQGMKPTNVKGLGLSAGGGCEVCGGALVKVRGRHPGEDDRQVCSTCAVEILESILDNCNNRQACSETNLAQQEEGK